MYGNLFKRYWVAKVVFLIQILLFFGGSCNGYFCDTRLKIYRLPYFNMLLQLVLFFKTELFLCLPQKPIQCPNELPRSLGCLCINHQKKEERKYWQMSINSAYRVNAFSQFSQVLPTLGIRKCTNIYEFQFLNCKIYCRLKRTETDLINHKGYFPKRYKTNWLIFELNETPLPRKRVSKSEMH